MGGQAGGSPDERLEWNWKELETAYSGGGAICFVSLKAGCHVKIA